MQIRYTSMFLLRHYEEIPNSQNMPQCNIRKIAQIFDEFTPAQKIPKWQLFFAIVKFAPFLHLQNKSSTNCVTNPKNRLTDRTHIPTKRQTNGQKPLLSWPTGQTDRQEIYFFISYVAFLSYDSSQTGQTYRQPHTIYCRSIMILVTIYHAIRF